MKEKEISKLKNKEIRKPRNTARTLC